MDTRLLTYFNTVAKLGNITRAANALHLTQPTLSRQLIELEHTLNTKLFIRGKREITLTQAGILFQARAQEMLALLEKTKKDLIETNTVAAGHVAIGLVETKIAPYIIKKICQFRKHYPQITFNLYNADGDDCREKLDKGSLDLTVLIEPVETAKYFFKPIGQPERRGVIMNKNDSLAQQEVMTQSDLLNRSFVLPRRTIVTNDIFEWLNIHSTDITIVSYYNLLTNVLPLILEENLLTIAVEGALSIRPYPDVIFRPLSPLRLTRHVIAWRKNISLSPTAQLFLDFLNHTEADR